MPAFVYPGRADHFQPSHPGDRGTRPLATAVRDYVPGQHNHRVVVTGYLERRATWSSRQLSEQRVAHVEYPGEREHVSLLRGNEVTRPPRLSEAAIQPLGWLQPHFP